MPSSKPSGIPALTLRDDGKAKLVIAKEIHERFYAMKTYGKEPESLGSITRLMLNDLADYPPEKIMAAFKTHAQRCAEFPTTHDLISIIRRNGKPPLRESEIIAIRKKAGEDRTAEDWAMLREWEREMNEGWDEPDAAKQAEAHADNHRLRLENQKLKAEVQRLSELLRTSPQPLAKPALTTEQKAVNTIRAMRQANAPLADIEEFAASMGLNPEDVA